MTDIEQTVRTRLRGLRTAQSLSLDDLAARSHLSPSTISRIETGKRAISLDVLLPLARALRTDVETLLSESDDEDVVIRPEPVRQDGHTRWMLSKATSSTKALKMRIEPSRKPPELKVHPGHDWLFVIEGVVHLHLGERVVTVSAGEAAEFETMTPHALTAADAPAEVIMIFDQDGHSAHVRRG